MHLDLVDLVPFKFFVRDLEVVLYHELAVADFNVPYRNCSF
jgi:hypothetical protein